MQPLKKAGNPFLIEGMLRGRGERNRNPVEGGNWQEVLIKRRGKRIFRGGIELGSLTQMEGCAQRVRFNFRGRRCSMSQKKGGKVEVVKEKKGNRRRPTLCREQQKKGR